MKKQWLSMILALCMVLCLTPTTARAAEGEKTCTLTINVEVEGLPKGVSAEGKTFTFDVKKAISGKPPRYYVYDTTTVNVGAGGKGTSTVSVEPGKYIVTQTGWSQQIGEHIWHKVTFTPFSNTIYESGEQEMTHDNKSITFTARNTYKPASETNVTTLPITVIGYKAGANVADAKVTTPIETPITLSSSRFMEKDSEGNWVPTSSATFQADTEYRIEVYFNKVTGCNYDGLTKDKVTVNGKEASEFEKNPSTQSGVDMRVFHELEVLKVVKTVERIEITTPPTKTVYNAGDKFDPTGMVVTAVYKEDGTTAVLSRDQYVIFSGNNDDKLREGQTYVTIQYNDGSGSSNIKVRLSITVGPYVGDHQHTYDDSPWYQDATSHWHQCTDKDCPNPSGSTKDQARHTFVWKVDKAATRTQTGLKHEECTVCHFKRNENTVIPVLSGHSPATKPDSGAENTAITSAKTGDAGIALYAVLSLLALSGSGWAVGKKRRGEK